MTDKMPAFGAFAEFPTPESLRRANTEYTNLLRGQDSGYKDSPYPTPLTKQQLFQLEDYKDIDNHALETPDDLGNKPLKELVQHLIHPAKNDLGKCRAIFRWITAQNLEAIGPTSGEDSAYHLLTQIRSSVGDYTDLFTSMCTLAGLQSQRVRGYAKGVGYEPGSASLEGSQGTWAVVQLDGVWGLVDPHWGSRSVSGGGSGDWQLIDDNGQAAKPTESDGQVKNIYACNEEYFLTDPEEMVYYHLPQDADTLQLLARPVSLREFTDMAYLKPSFFQLGLRLGSHRKAVLDATDGEAEIELGLPETGERKFIYRLWRSTKNTQDTSFGDYQLERYVLMQQNRKVLKCRISFPVEGTYKLELYGRDPTDASSTSYKTVCAYIINVDEAMEEVRALPENSRKEWGPGYDLISSGLRPVSHTSGVIEADHGQTEIRFKIEKGRKVNLLHRLHSNTNTAEELSNFITHHIDGDEMVVNIKLPDTGDYALNLFVNEGGKGSFTNVCSYLVSTADPAFDLTPFPDMTNGRIGGTTDNDNIALNPISQKTPYVECPDSGELELEFIQNSLISVVTELFKQTKDGPKKLENYCMHTDPVGDRILFIVRFPESGLYALKIYAKQLSSESNALHNVYNYIIKVSCPMIGCLPYPTLYSTWGEGCELRKPTSESLPAQEDQIFEVTVPGASRLAVINGEKWTFLDKGDGDIWTGTVNTGDPGSKLSLSVEFESKPGSFSSLLAFKVKDGAELDTIKKAQEKLKLEAEEERKKQEAFKESREREFEEAKTALQEAKKSKNLGALKKVMRVIEKIKVVSRLQKDMEEAKVAAKSLEATRTLNDTVAKMDPAKLSEITNHQDAPPHIHDVMVAALLLLGYSEAKTRGWEVCQTLCLNIGFTGFRKRIEEFDVHSLHPQIVSRSLFIIQQYRLDDVRDRSEGAAIFYIWIQGIIEEYHFIHPEAVGVSPASIEQQQQILGEVGSDSLDSTDHKVDSDPQGEKLESEPHAGTEPEVVSDLQASTAHEVAAEPQTATGNKVDSEPLTESDHEAETEPQDIDNKLDSTPQDGSQEHVVEDVNDAAAKSHRDLGEVKREQDTEPKVRDTIGDDEKHKLPMDKDKPENCCNRYMILVISAVVCIVAYYFSIDGSHPEI